MDAPEKRTVTDEETAVEPPTESIEAAPAARRRWTATRIARLLLDQWLLAGLGVACVLGYFFPNVAKTDGILRAQYSILYGAVAYIFLLSGLCIPRAQLVVHLTNWRLHVLVQGMSFVFTPLSVTAVVHLVLAADRRRQVLDRAVLAGYVLLGCLPTTISSNAVMTRAAGGDEAAVLVEVLVANLLGPFVTPAWTVALLPRDAAFDVWRGATGSGGALAPMYAHVFRQIGLSVLLPLVVGQAARWAWPGPVARTLARWPALKKLSTVCLLLITWTTFSSCFATDAFALLSPGCIAFVLLFNVALYLVWTAVAFVLARPPCVVGRWDRLGVWRPVAAREAVAICFCAPAKTTALGIPLLNAMWASVALLPRSTASIPVLLFTTEQIFVAHFVVHFFRWWLARPSTEGAREEEC